MVKQKQQPKLRSLAKKLGILLLISVGILALWAAGNVLYGKWLDQQDEVRYAKLASDTSSIYTQIYKELPGLHTTYKKYCTQGSVKFQEPLKQCNIDVDGSFRFNDTNEAKRVVREFEKIVNNATKNFTGLNQGRYTEFPTKSEAHYDGREISYQDKTISCGTFFEIKDSDTNTINLHFGCSGYSRALYY